MKSFTQIQPTAWSLTALLLLMVSNVFAADPPAVVPGKFRKQTPRNLVPVSFF